MLRFARRVVRKRSVIEGSMAHELLTAADVLVETTGRKRDRSFMYRAYLDRLKVGTELHEHPP